MTSSQRVHTIASWSFRLLVVSHLLSLAWIFFVKTTSEASVPQILYVSGLMALIVTAFIGDMMSQVGPGDSRIPDAVIAVVWISIVHSAALSSADDCSLAVNRESTSPLAFPNGSLV